jgi:hypothetical protein
MARKGTVSATTNIPVDPGRPIQAAFQAAIKRATFNLKGLATLLAALGGLAVTFHVFEDNIQLHEPWLANR